MTDLERSHTELRAALILAGKEIRKLNFGKRNSSCFRRSGAYSGMRGSWRERV
jgi:hypothetical protein